MAPGGYEEATLQQVKKVDIHYSIVQELFRECPFCGEKPNVFQVPEDRYGPNAPYGWVVECKNMGCIFTRPIWLPPLSRQKIAKVKVEPRGLIAAVN